MGRRVVLMGDPIDHGGCVLAGSLLDCIRGRGIARLGDPVMCARHGPTVIAEGEMSAIVDGRPVALDGHRTACGATLQASGDVEWG